MKLRPIGSFLTLLLCTSLAYAENCCARTSRAAIDCTGCLFPPSFFQPRPQATNAARQLSGVQKEINRYDVESLYGMFAITPEYTQSFNPNLFTKYYFGPAAHGGSVTFSGSLVEDRGPYEILADYFGCSQTFKSVVHFEPKIQNAIIDFDFYLGLDEWIENAYIRVFSPLVYTRWGMNASECIISTGTQGFPASYMDEDAIPLEDLPKGVLPAFAGCATWGDMTIPMKYGKISPDTLTMVKMADVHVMAGYNFFNNEKAHAGMCLLAVFPTGNKPNGEYLFEPMIGNGGHYEAGLGFTGHCVLWEHEDSNKSLALYSDLYLTHIFGTEQVRSFDFETENALSRYMLLAQFEDVERNQYNYNDCDNCLSNAGYKYRYAGQLFPSVNISTVCCEVWSQLQADFVLKLAYTHNNFEFDLGFNLWGRSHEQIKVSGEVSIDRFALKGDAFLYGAVNPAADTNTTPSLSLNTPFNARAAYAANTPGSRVPLSAMQEERATIYTGANFVPGRPYGLAVLNPGVDNLEKAYQQLFSANGVPISNAQLGVYSAIYGNGPEDFWWNINATTTGPTATTTDAQRPPQIRTSIPPNFITQTAAFEPTSAATPTCVSYKIFANISHRWADDERRAHPFVAVGGEVEWAANLGASSCSCQPPLNQWGVWLKGGVGF